MEALLDSIYSRSIADMALVLIDTADILVARFLRMLMIGGRRLGFPSIALFFAAFGLAYKAKSKGITSLLVAGGAINLGSLLVTRAIGQLHYWRNILMGIIAVGSITVGLDILGW